MSFYQKVGGREHFTVTVSIATSGTIAGAVIARIAVPACSALIICKTLHQGYGCPGASVISIYNYEGPIWRPMPKPPSSAACTAYVIKGRLAFAPSTASCPPGIDRVVQEVLTPSH